MNDAEQNQELEPLDADTGDHAPVLKDTRDYVEAAVAKVEKAEAAKAEAKDDKAALRQDDAPRGEHNPFNAWKKEAQVELAKLPAHLQAMIKERDALFNKTDEDYKSKIERHYKGDVQFARTMNRALAPHNDYIKEMGVTPDVAVSTLLHTERTLRTGSPEVKTAMLQQLAHAYGIDLKTAVQQPFDPRLNTLQQQNHWLNSRIEDQKATLQDAEDRQIQSVFQRFAQTHEHFDAVKGTIASLLEKGLAKNLDDAYNKAIRLDDGVYGKLQAQQLEALKRAQQQQADQAAKAARAANVSVRGAPTGVTHAKPAETVEQAVRNAMVQHGLLP